MAAYCLPKQYASAFLKALQEGKIDPVALADMTSADRRKFFEPIVGVENSQEVNALFESKLLLKNKQAGLITWAKNVAGLTEPARRDLVAKINRLPEAVLNPAAENKFLADLAAQKLGVAVTADEAKEIFDLAKQVETLKNAAGRETDPVAWTAYGRAKIALTDRIESLKPTGQTWGQLLLEAVNIPRTIMSTMDLSAPLVQGWGLEGSGTWRDAFVRMHSYLAREESYQELRGWIVGHPLFDLIDKSGLSLTELGQKLSAREETIQSTLVERAFEYGITRTTGIPNLARASNRAFTGFINYARFKTMVDMIEAARMAGIDVSEGSQILKDFAATINNFSGRGQIGGARAENLITGLNAVFFAPRKTAGTIQMFNPANMLNPRINKMARIKATKMLMGSVLYTGAVIGLARAMGATVDLDPRSSDFLQIGIGNTKFDVTGGNATYLRFMARMATNQMVNSNDELKELGEGYRATTRADLLLQFLRNKLAPVAAFTADALYGKDPIGRPFSMTEEARDKLMPMTVNDFIDFAMHDPGNYAAVLPVLSAIYGVSLRPPTPGFNNAKRDVWGQPKGTSYDDAVERALHRIQIYPELPPRKIRGVELTPDEYDYYQQVVGPAMRRGTAAAVRTPGFERYSLGRQEEMIRDSWKNQREQAINVVIAKYRHITRDAEKLQQEIKSKGSLSARKARGETVQ